MSTTRSPIINKRNRDEDGENIYVSDDENKDNNKDDKDLETVELVPTQADIDRKEIRSMWELAYIHHFLTSFVKPLHLKTIYIDEIENALLLPTDYKVYLADIFVPLLRQLGVKPKPGTGGLNEKTWETILKHEVGRKSFDHYQESTPYDEDNESYAKLKLSDRVMILKGLCDLQLSKSKNLLDNIKETDPEEIRTAPIGSDKNKLTYWYFGDTRLYREPRHNNRRLSTPKKGEKRWELVCSTKEEWDVFIAGIENSDSTNEKNLYTALVELLPDVHDEMDAYSKYKQKKERDSRQKQQQEILSSSGRVIRQFRSPRLAELQLNRLVAEREEQERRKQLGLPVQDDEDDEEEEFDSDVMYAKALGLRPRKRAATQQQQNSSRSRDSDDDDDDEEPAEPTVQHSSSGRRIVTRRLDSNGLPMLPTYERKTRYIDEEENNNNESEE